VKDQCPHSLCVYIAPVFSFFLLFETFSSLFLRVSPVLPLSQKEVFDLGLLHLLVVGSIRCGSFNRKSILTIQPLTFSLVLDFFRPLQRLLPFCFNGASTGSLSLLSVGSAHRRASSLSSSSSFVSAEDPLHTFCYYFSGFCGASPCRSATFFPGDSL